MLGAGAPLKAVPSLFETATLPAASTASTRYWTCRSAWTGTLRSSVWPSLEREATAVQVPGCAASV